MSKVMAAADSRPPNCAPDLLFYSPDLFPGIVSEASGTIITLATCRHPISYSPTLPDVDKSRDCK